MPLRRLSLVLLLPATLAWATQSGPQMGGPAPGGPDSSAAQTAASPPLTRESVDAAAAQLRRDPALQASRHQRTLRIKPDDDDQPARGTPAWISWLRGAFDWLNESGRFLVWALGMLAVALLALRLRTLLHGAAVDRRPGTLRLPTHVSQLDIRPQTLPADVGAAAAALWQAGRSLDAMSLLYRGALSQLVHAWALPIRSSSTEGDCLQLARPRLPAATQHYLVALVAAWRSTVYAGRPPPGDAVLQLCADFGPRLAGPAPPAAS